MLEEFRKIIEEITGNGNVNLDTDFLKDLALSSFDVMNIISAVEEKYNITIPVRDVWKMQKVKDAINYLKDKGFSE